MRNLYIYQYKELYKTVCHIQMYAEHKAVCDFLSNEQIIVTKKSLGYVVNINGISLYCDKIEIDGEYFTENQIILNFGDFDDIKSVNKSIELK